MLIVGVLVVGMFAIAVSTYFLHAASWSYVGTSGKLVIALLYICIGFLKFIMVG